MGQPGKPVSILSHFIHEHFLWFLVGSYALAAICPGPGLSIRGLTFGRIHIGHESTDVTLPMLMLAGLLFNAGLGVQIAELRTLRRTLGLLGAGLVANLVFPVVFILGVSHLLRLYHDAAEAQQVLVGLALIAAMPIAGSSTAWSQNANGDLALSLGLVLGSTFFSPLTTPITFDLVEHMASGEYAQILDALESNGTGAVLMVCVLVPSLLGIFGKCTVGAARLAPAKPTLKLVNSVNLLLLNYANAAVSLPQAAAKRDWDYLAVILLIVVGLCAFAFAAGWWLARLLKADQPQRIALMFGLGMNNNGTALVLASMALAHYPQVLLPIICYNLVQHLAAGIVDRYFWARPTASPAAGQGSHPVHGSLRYRTQRLTD